MMTMMMMIIVIISVMPKIESRAFRMLGVNQRWATPPTVALNLH